MVSGSSSSTIRIRAFMRSLSFGRRTQGRDRCRIALRALIGDRTAFDNVVNGFSDVSGVVAHALDVLGAEHQVNAEGDIARIFHHVSQQLAKNGRADCVDFLVAAVCTSVFRELLTYMMEDPRNITFCIHLMFCAKNIERMGDHATNIAETVHYIIEGRPIADQRPKGDTTTIAALRTAAER